MKHLTVYAMTADRHHGGGMAVIAAHTEAEACLLANRIGHHLTFNEPNLIQTLPVTYKGKARVLTHFSIGE